MKIVLIFILLVLVLSIFALGYYSVFDGEFHNSYTSAVCDGNVCQDHLFTCVGGEIVNSTVISGFVVLGEEWVDRRENKKVC